MSNYIDVDILRAEIKRKKPKLRKICGQDCKMTTTQVGKLFDGILSFVDSNSEPGVDLENELKKYCKEYYNYDYPEQGDNCSSVMPHVIETARRFFELGKRAQRYEDGNGDN